MRKYDSYIESNIEWVGKIPSHWEVNRLKYHIEFLTGYPFKSDNYKEKGIKLARGINVKEGVFNWTETKYWESIEPHLEEYLLNSGDVLIGMDGSKVGKNFCQVQESDLPVLLLQRVARLRTEDALYDKFLFWNIANKGFLYWVEISKTEPMVPHIAPKDIRNFIVTIPTVDEQTQIANYLDQKTTQIDTLISNKEKLIELLKEERTAIINQAVTKGLDPNVPMKDSGIEWLGEIPEGWDRARIKTLVAIKVCDGPHETPNWVEDGVPFISAEAIKGNQIDLNYKRGYISMEQHLEYCKKSKVIKGDILFCKSGSTTGKSAMVEIDDDFGIWSPLAIIRVNRDKISNSYMFQSIQSSLFKNQVETSWTFGTQPNIGMGALENLWIAIPPISEQEQIDIFLKNELAKFDLILAKTQQEIELLKEYKTALISEVVTGKVDVRDEAVDLING